MRFRVDIRNFCQDVVDIHFSSAGGAFAQIVFGVDGSELFGHGTAHKLIHRDAFAARESLRVMMDGVGKSDAQGVHDFVGRGNWRKSGPGAITRMSLTWMK